MMLRLLQDLDSHARTRSLAPAIYGAGQDQPAFTWETLRDRVASVADTLQREAPAGGTVLLCGPNCPEYIAAFLGVLAAGDTLFPISCESAGPELASAARRCLAGAAIVEGQAASALAPYFERARPFSAFSNSAWLLSGPKWNAATGGEGALLLQSSGTTAEPKIVRRDGPSLDAVAANMVRACGFGSDEHVLAAVPLCHSYGLEHGLLAPISAGSCVHVCQGFDLPVVLNALRSGAITRLPGVPIMFEMLCQSEAGPFPSLKKAYSAGGPLPRTTLDSFEQSFGLRLGQVYGATEIGSVTYNDPGSFDFDPASVGKAMDGVSIKILDADSPDINHPLHTGKEGQVAIAAPSMLSGYVGHENLPLINGHYLTGDLGKVDKHGSLTITGRLKLLIDVGGRKVNPAEVEAVLRQHPQVGACIVLPMRLSETACRLRAIVTRSSPTCELSAQELRRFVRERLSAYKVPRVFEIRQSLPTSPGGKVLRRLVEAS